MIASLQTLKRRIRSVENTKKVTSAMEMISVAKLNQTDRVLHAVRDYAQKLEGILHDLITNAEGMAHPLLIKKPATGKIYLCVIASDSGLCGAYNNNVFHKVNTFLLQHPKESVEVIVVGRKATNHFKEEGLAVHQAHVGFNGRYTPERADAITLELINLYLHGDAREVHVAYTHYGAKRSHQVSVMKFLNLEPDIQQRKQEFFLEPTPEKIFQEILPRYISLRFRLILLEAFAAEHSARAVAMKTATDNAKELLEELVLLRNKVCQANITRDILEIISSAEALGG